MIYDETSLNCDHFISVAIYTRSFDSFNWLIYVKLPMFISFLWKVLQIHSYGRQKRVKARFVKGGKLSIPLEYPMEIYVKEGSTGGEGLALSSFIVYSPFHR